MERANKMKKRREEDYKNGKHCELNILDNLDVTEWPVLLVANKN